MRLSEMPLPSNKKSGSARSKNYSGKTHCWIMLSLISHCLIKKLLSTPNLTNCVRKCTLLTEPTSKVIIEQCRRALKIRLSLTACTRCLSQQCTTHISPPVPLLTTSSVSPTRTASTIRKEPMSSMCQQMAAQNRALSRRTLCASTGRIPKNLTTT